VSASTCLLDTGPLVAFLDRTDSRHNSAVELIDPLNTPFKSCEAVLSEACFLLRRGGVSHLINQVFLMIEKRFLEIELSFKESQKRIGKLMHQYRNVPMSFADACLVALAEKYQEPRILTFDQNFEIYRWGKGRKFQILS